MRIKALTISQPYAELIASGQKFVENRHWPTNYRGLLAIHAGKGMQYLDKEEIKRYDTGCIVAIAELIACLPLRWMQSHARIGGGHTLVESIRFGESLEFASAKDYHAKIGRMASDAGITIQKTIEHEHAEGPHCWILQNIRRIKPIPCKGAQGLWVAEVEEGLINQ
jgi:hypothetical protein